MGTRGAPQGGHGPLCRGGIGRALRQCGRGGARRQGWGDGKVHFEAASVPVDAGVGVGVFCSWGPGHRTRDRVSPLWVEWVSAQESGGGLNQGPAEDRTEETEKRPAQWGLRGGRGGGPHRVGVGGGVCVREEARGALVLGLLLSEVRPWKEPKPW